MSLAASNTIDLRQIAPPERHPLVLSSFDALLPGQTFELTNDHDSQALNAQLALRSPGLVSWRCLENGPTVWRIEIGKNAQTAQNKSGGCCSGGGCCG